MPRKPIKRISGWGFGIKGVEEGIRSLVADLNYTHGFRTNASCEGGPGHGSPGAWISMEGQEYTKDDFDEMREVVKAHTDVPFKIGRGSHGNIVIQFVGPLVGQYVSPEEHSWQDDDYVESTLLARGELQPEDVRYAELLEEV